MGPVRRGTGPGPHCRRADGGPDSIEFSLYPRQILGSWGGSRGGRVRSCVTIGYEKYRDPSTLGCPVTDGPQTFAHLIIMPVIIGNVRSSSSEGGTHERGFRSSFHVAPTAGDRSRRLSSAFSPPAPRGRCFARHGHERRWLGPDRAADGPETRLDFSPSEERSESGRDTIAG